MRKRLLNTPHHAEICTSHNFSKLLMSKIAIDFQKHLPAYRQARCRVASESRGGWGPLGLGEWCHGAIELIWNSKHWTHLITPSHSTRSWLVSGICSLKDSAENCLRRWFNIEKSNRSGVYLVMLDANKTEDDGNRHTRRSWDMSLILILLWKTN